MKGRLKFVQVFDLNCWAGLEVIRNHAKTATMTRLYLTHCIAMKKPQHCNRSLVAAHSLLILIVAAAISLISPLQAAISVGPTGVGPLTFDTTPTTNEFATGVLVGGGTTFSDVTTMDAGVAMVTAASITRLLPTSGTQPPSTFSGGFRHNTGGLYLQSRPVTDVTNAANVMLAILQNDSGSDRALVTISYDFAVQNPLVGELPGFNVYYSLTGEANSWTPIAGLTGSEAAGSALGSVSLGSWPVGSPLYILWADDNANGITDPSYTIDNFAVRFAIDPPAIAQQPVSVTVTQVQTIRLTVSATGPGLQYLWHKGGTPMDVGLNPTAAQATLVITNSALTDDADYYVIVSNPATSVTSATVHATVIPDTFPPILLSASGDPANLNSFILRVSEPLDPDTAGDIFNWFVEAIDGSAVITIDALLIDGTNIVFTTNVPRTPGTLYRIGLSAGGSGVCDIFNNCLPPGGAAVDVSPTVLFQQGVDAYTGTRDIELRGAAPDASQEGALGVTVDTDDGGGISHGLLRFDNIFGANPGQVPPGAQITSATLRLQHNVANANGNPVNLHRMLVTWDSAATYNSFVGGIQANGNEATAVIDVVVDSTGRTVPFTLSADVSTSVQAWANGEPNYGWAFLPTGTDGYRWDTSESATPPSLVIAYTVPPCSPLAIVTQPATNTSINEGSLFALSVAVTSPGCAATFQWSKGGTDIPNATNSVYSVASTAPSDAGAYQVRVANTAPSSATSTIANVAVTADTNRPALTRAVSPNSTTVVLTFSKSLAAASAENVANYTFTPPVTVSGAVLANGANSATVTLTTAARSYPSIHTLRIAEVTDNRSSLNLINPNPIHVAFTLFEVVESYTAAPWTYSTNIQDGVNWMASDFIPGPEWLTGMAFFGTEPTAAITNALPVQPNPIVTPIAPNDNATSPDQFVTAYFRRQITLPSLPANASFAICHWTDDGAIFYLDGVEIHRFNMPEGSATFVTRASVGQDSSLQCFLFNASAGTHTLAVEVHQGGTTTTDGLFGAEVRAVTLPPAVSISRDGAGNNTVHFTADSTWQLVGSANVAGPYAPVAGNPLSTFVVPVAAQTNNQFFHLRYRDNP